MNWNKAVFIAHASKDKPKALEIFEILRENGLDPWLDQESLSPGDRWEVEIRQAIKKARFFVPLLSKNSVGQDGYVQRELRLALKELEEKSPDAHYFMPVLIDEVEVPSITVGTIEMRDYHATRITNKAQLDRFVTQLLKHVSTIEGIEKKETPSFQGIRNSIATGQVETALRLMLEQSGTIEGDLYNSVVLIASRYNRVSKENILGLIPREQYTIEVNQVVYSILELLRILEEKP